MTVPYAFLIVFLLLQVITLYYVVCLSCDLSRHDDMGCIIRNAAHDIHKQILMAQCDHQIVVNRLDSLTETATRLDDDILFIGRQFGFIDQEAPADPTPAETFGGKPSGADAPAMKTTCGVIPSAPDKTPDYPGTAAHVTFTEGGGHD